MKASAGIYSTPTQKTLAIYNRIKDVYTLPPEGVEKKALIHFSYKKWNKEGSGDIFLIDDSFLESSVNLNKKISTEKNNIILSKLKNGKGTYIYPKDEIEKARAKYGVRFEIRQDIRDSELEQQLTDMALTDILDFCGEREPKNKPTPETNYVNRIIPVTKLREIQPNAKSHRLLDGGKQWFIPQCILEANIDFAKGCITSFVPGEEAFFDGENFIDWYFDPSAECEYCYAANGQNKHKSYPKTFHKIDFKLLDELLRGDFRPNYGDDETTLGKNIEILRFGKRT